MSVLFIPDISLFIIIKNLFCQSLFHRVYHSWCQRWDYRQWECAEIHDILLFMIMRSGRRYRSIVEEAAMAEGVAEVLKAFMEDRKQREEELRTREAEMREERRRRDEEMARREEESRRQMDLLQSLVEGMMKQSEATSKKSDSQKDVRVAKLTEQDDIKAYLTTFK